MKQINNRFTEVEIKIERNTIVSSGIEDQNDFYKIDFMGKTIKLKRLSFKRMNGDVLKLIAHLKEKDIAVLNYLNNDENVFFSVTSNDGEILDLSWEHLSLTGKKIFDSKNRMIIRKYKKNIFSEKEKGANIFLMPSPAWEEVRQNTKPDGNISSSVKNEVHNLLDNVFEQQKQLSKLIFEKNFSLKNSIVGYYALVSPSVNNFESRSLKEYNIFHYIGHTDAKKGVGFSLDEGDIIPEWKGNEDNINNNRFLHWDSVEIVKKLSETPFYLVFFSACDAAAHSEQNSLSLLFKCIDKGDIKYAIGYRGKIGTEIAREFSTIFYENLFGKKIIDSNNDYFNTSDNNIISSYWLARKQVFESKNSSKYWDKPVLYITG